MAEDTALEALKAQSFFQKPCKKGGVASWLLFRVKFSEYRAQLRMQLQDGV